jgi:hypothetical protein
MRFIFVGFLLCMICVLSDASFELDIMRLVWKKPFELEPVIVHPVKNYNFSIKSQETSVVDIMINIKNSFTEIDQNELYKISTEIMLACETGITTNVRSLRWEFTINDNQGILLVISVNALISRNYVDITGGVIKLEQRLPAMYRTEEKCAKTGSRKYGIVGPRKNECNYHNIRRALNGDELIKVNQALTSQLVQAMMLLN